MIKPSFRFIEEYSPFNENLHALSDVQIRQLKICTLLYYGEEDAAEIDTSDLDNLFDGEMERWTSAVLYHLIDDDTNEVMYDFWEYNADSGTVFKHNSTEHIGLFMMQFHFGFVERNKHSKHLPDNFPQVVQAAYKACE